MNQNSFDEGKVAYQKGDWLLAITCLSQAKETGELFGNADHLLGNSYMQLGQFSSAVAAYESALQDTEYGKKGPISANLGRAYLALNRPSDAVSALQVALQDEEYGTPYKAYLALGQAYERLGDTRNAGIAYRNAAIDEANPAPSTALTSLGSCFMQLSRPIDAIEAFRTALDFTSDATSQNKVYQELGLAYVAANRMSEAADAFSHATSDGSFNLSAEAQAAYDACLKAISTVSGKSLSDTDALLAATGYGTGSYDPLDPMGASGELMPSPEDTGFFEVSEADLMAEDRRARKKHRHTGLRIFFTLLFLALLAAAALGFAYWRGFGWPTQQAVVENLFRANVDGLDLGNYISSSVSSEQRTQIENLLPENSAARITGIDQSMTESVAYVVASLPGGGTQDYTVELVRDGIGWKVVNVSLAYASQNGETPVLSDSGTLTEG